MAFRSATRARIYLRDSATFGERPTRTLIAEAFAHAGIEDLSIHHGIMGFDRASAYSQRARCASTQICR